MNSKELFIKTLSQFILVFLLISIFNANQSSYAFSACENEFKKNEEGHINCKTGEVVKISESENLSNLENIFKYEESTNINSPFLQKYTKFLTEQLNANKKMLILKKLCFCENQSQSNKSELFKKYGLKIDQEQLFQNCPDLRKNYLQKISEDYPNLVRSRHLGWTKFEGHFNHSSFAISTVQSLSYENFPVNGEAVNHVVDNVLGKIEKLPKELEKEINDTNLLNATSIFKSIDPDFYEQKIKKALDKKGDLAEKQKINTFKKIFSDYLRLPTNKAPEILYRLNEIKKEQKLDYFERLGKNPILAHVNSSKPTNEELTKAFDEMIKSNEDLIEKIARKEISLEELFHFSPMLNKFLTENKAFCKNAFLVDNSLRKEALRKGRNELIVAAGSVASCLAAPFASTTIVGVSLFAGCTAVPVGFDVADFIKNKEKEEQLVLEINLNDQYLLGRDFNELNKVEQDKFINYAMITFGVLPLFTSVKSLKSAKNATLSKKAIDIKNVQFIQQPVKKELLEDYLDLPFEVTTKLSKHRNRFREKGFTKIDEEIFNKKNSFTNEESKKLNVLISDAPEKFHGPFIKVVEKFSDTGAWADYYEKTMVKIIRKMLKSNDPKLVGLAQKGIVSEKVLIEYFKDRFKERGLEISEIAPNSGVLSFNKFKEAISKGPVWDRAFENGNNTGHGPYPHLFQLDYALDDMMEASAGQIKSYQEFFDYFGKSDNGLAIWNDVFDLNRHRTTYTLRDTNVLTLDSIMVFPIAR